MGTNEQDRFAAELTHQLKTPLSVLQTSATNFRRNLRTLLEDLTSLTASSGSSSVMGFVSQALSREPQEPMTGMVLPDRVELVVQRLRDAGVDGDLNAAASSLVREGWDTYLDAIAPHLCHEPALVLEILEAAARLRNNLHAIESSAERIGRLSVALRALSGPAPAELVDVRAGLEETVTMLRPVLAGRVRIELDVADLPAVTGSADLVAEIWSNLIMNAAQAMGDGGVLRIEASPSPGAGEVTVRFIDDGAGIPAEVQEKMFEPFFTTRASEGGSGLGLALVQRIVGRLGGRIDVSSEPGRTCFELTLPAVAAAAAQEE